MPDVTYRPYQLRTFDQVEELIAHGQRRIVIVAPTGAGKTTIAAKFVQDALRAQRPVLFIAHRKELIDQAYNRLVHMGVPRSRIGVIMGEDGRRNPGALVQVASISSLVRRVHPSASLVLIDECHRAPAGSYKKVTASYPDAIHLGLTATPMRNDNRGLSDVYDALVEVASPQELMDQGYLVEPVVYTVPQGELPDFKRVRVRKGEYDIKQLESLLNQGRLVGDIIAHWRTLGADKQTLVFAVSVAHAEHIAERFREQGVSAAAISGATPKKEREQTLKDFEERRIHVLVNVNVLTEGTDLPIAKCAILARPTKSTSLYLQMVGRILRPFGGQKAVILDHAGCTYEHGFPQDRRAFSLEGRDKSDGEAPFKLCAECGMAIPTGCKVCALCGAEQPGPETTSLDEREAELEAVESETIKERRFDFECWAVRAGNRAFNPKWIAYQFKQKYGQWPPKAWMKEVPTIQQDPTRTGTLFQHFAAQSDSTDAWERLHFATLLECAPSDLAAKHG